jgi:hypothetical protein
MWSWVIAIIIGSFVTGIVWLIIEAKNAPMMDEWGRVIETKPVNKDKFKK